MADLYDGETYDATVDLNAVTWRKAAQETLRVHPVIEAQYGLPVVAHEAMKPTACHKAGDETVYDFGQNFAGVVCLQIRGRKGQNVKVRHAEILNPDGSLNVSFLRSAKATATYTCVDGEQSYSPRFSYMGFRYVGVSGIDQKDIEVTAVPVYSDLEEAGGFTCSNELLNRLQQNIQWGARSNFVDIPTDCPQRDERMGWTGDIAVFGQTACFNFDMARFLDKWLADMRSEQNRGGGLPNTVPVHLYGFPATMPRMAIDWWGDACVIVPWVLYEAYGDREILAKRKHLESELQQALLRNDGDWVAPDVPKMQQWQARSKWTATASLYHTSSMTGKIARILGHADEAAKYEKLAENVSKAYIHVFTDGQGRLKNEFQTGYVLPLQFHMFPDGVQEKAAENLTALVKKNNWCIGTGFPGTPYILFALADNGQKDAAYQMLMNTRCPSWLYEVKVGATTIWERWDGLDENGQCPIGDDGTDKMISYNHYASGAVGDFLYRRVAGLEPLEPGYRRFRVKPIPGGGLTQACAWTETPYGRVQAEWEIKDHQMTVKVTVPVGAEGELILPDGRQVALQSGVHTQTCPAE